jgi:hypothetical protein
MPMPFTTIPVVPITMDKLNVVVDVLKERETSVHQRPAQHLPKENCLSRGFDKVKPEMLKVAIANVNGWGLRNHDKPGAPCACCETVVALPCGVETGIKRDGAVASVDTGRNEKNEKYDKIECATAGTESNIARSRYGSGGSTTSCAAFATRFDPKMKGKA